MTTTSDPEAEAPQEPEDWDQIMLDVEDKIMPGVTHWQHPRFHAYFPAGNSFPSILGDMLGDGIGCIGFSWAASPACTELETIVLDWLGKAIGLPDHFLALKEGSTGGGVIQVNHCTSCSLFPLSVINLWLRKLDICLGVRAGHHVGGTCPGTEAP